MSAFKILKGRNKRCKKFRSKSESMHIFFLFDLRAKEWKKTRPPGCRHTAAVGCLLGLGKLKKLDMKKGRLA